MCILGQTGILLDYENMDRIQTKRNIPVEAQTARLLVLAVFELH